MPRSQQDHAAQRPDLREVAHAPATAVPLDAPGWLLRSPACRVVEHLAPWSALADGGSFAALLDDPIDAHLILTRFPASALARTFCGGPALAQVARAVTGTPRGVAARVWVGGYGTRDEGISVAAVYVRFEDHPSRADTSAGRHPMLWDWFSAQLGNGTDDRWPEPDEISRDRTDVRTAGTWWRLRWGPSRTPYARPARTNLPGGLRRDDFR